MSTRTIHPSHRWSDISYHGSPTWECDFCDCSKYDEVATQPCPKADEKLEQERKTLESQESAEYAGLLRQVDRFAYLHTKYGKR